MAGAGARGPGVARAPGSAHGATGCLLMGAADSSIPLPPEPVGGRCGLADGCKPRGVRTGRAQLVPLVLFLGDASELLSESGLLLYLLLRVCVAQTLLHPQAPFGCALSPSRPSFG